MNHLGDFPEDFAGLVFLWNSYNSDGASVTRATDGTISVYKDGGTSQSTAGVTDTEDFDSLTGIHKVVIDLSADAFYAPGSEYDVVLSAATIDGQTVNTVLAHFSIERAGGTLALLKAIKSGAGVNVTQFGGANLTASGGRPEVNATHLAGTAYATAIASLVTDIWAKATSALSTASSIGKLLVDNINATISSRLATAGYTAPDNSGIGTAASAAAAAAASGSDIQSRLPAALTATGNMKADALRVDGSATAASNLKSGALGIVASTCAASSTSTVLKTNLTEATNDHYNGRVVVFTSGALAGQATSIEDYDGTAKELTVVELTEAPADTDAFVIV